MFTCCSQPDPSAQGKVIEVTADSNSEPPEPEAEAEEQAGQVEEANAKRKAVEGAAAAQRTREAEDQARRKKVEEANAKRKADEEAAAAQRTREAEDEARRKKEAEAAKPAAPPAAPPSVEAGVPLVFRDPSGAKTYTASFKSKPLGIVFNKKAKPPKVLNVFGAAKALDVQVGSELIGVAGTDVGQMDFGQGLELLEEAIAQLPAEGLEVIFRDTAGQQKTIIFPSKPLDLTFLQNRKPIKIKEATGTARKLGVQANWDLMRIAGTDVEQMDFAQILELLQAKIQTLPSMD